MRYGIGPSKLPKKVELRQPKKVEQTKPELSLRLDLSLLPHSTVYCELIDHIPDQCFETGNYQGTASAIDVVENINGATSCQEECQKHEECQFWTYNSQNKKCFRQTQIAPQNLGTCNTCTRGPRNCANGK